jgi:hypothetical protein
MWPQVLIFWDGWSTGVYRCPLDLCGLRWGVFFERGTLGVELLSIRHACFLSIRFRSERNGTERTWFRERGGICFAQLAKPNLLQLNWAKNAWRVRIGYSFRSYGAVVRELGVVPPNSFDSPLCLEHEQDLLWHALRLFTNVPKYVKSFLGLKIR